MGKNVEGVHCCDQNQSSNVVQCLSLSCFDSEKSMHTNEHANIHTGIQKSEFVLAKNTCLAAPGALAHRLQ